MIENDELFIFLQNQYSGQKKLKTRTLGEPRQTVDSADEEAVAQLSLEEKIRRRKAKLQRERVQSKPEVGPRDGALGFSIDSSHRHRESPCFNHSSSGLKDMDLASGLDLHGIKEVQHFRASMSGDDQDFDESLDFDFMPSVGSTQLLQNNINVLGIDLKSSPKRDREGNSSQARLRSGEAIRSFKMSMADDDYEDKLEEPVKDRKPVTPKKEVGKQLYSRASSQHKAIQDAFQPTKKEDNDDVKSAYSGISKVSKLTNNINNNG